MLVVPQMSSAGLLVGFNDFDTNADPESQDETVSPLSGQVIKSVASFKGTATGSTDGRYGVNRQSDAPPLSNVANNNGYLNLGVTPVGGGSGSIRFAITNSSTDVYTLTFLRFDLVTTTIGQGAKVTTGGTALTIGTTPVVTGTIGAGGYNLGAAETSDDYFDITQPILLLIGANSTRYFDFERTNQGLDVRLDNIAFEGVMGDLTAVPEPGSLVALGCLVGSGAFLRSRRRNVRL